MYQRILSKKKKGSNNYYKAKQRLALIHEKIHNTRYDYLHKISHEIISENQVIITEDLQIKNMVKNHKPYTTRSSEMLTGLMIVPGPT